MAQQSLCDSEIQKELPGDKVIQRLSAHQLETQRYWHTNHCQEARPPDTWIYRDGTLLFRTPIKVADMGAKVLGFMTIGYTRSITYPSVLNTRKILLMGMQKLQMSIKKFSAELGELQN